MELKLNNTLPSAGPAVRVPARGEVIVVRKGLVFHFFVDTLQLRRRLKMAILECVILAGSSKSPYERLSMVCPRRSRMKCT